MSAQLGRRNDLGLGQGLALKLLTAFCMLLLLAPLVVLVVYAFNDSRQVTVWQGFSLKWFAVTLQDREIWFAFRNSLIIGGLNAVLATILGTMAALAIARHRFAGRQGFLNLLHYPVLLPEIIIGIALLVLFVLLDVPRGFGTVVAGHVTFSFPLVALLVLARVGAMSRTLEEASLDLGASRWQTYRFVILPALAPAIVSGVLFCFTLSLDDFVITLFTASPDVTTLPLKVYSMVKFGLTPVINVISVLLILFTLTVLLAIHWLQKEGPHQRWGIRLAGVMVAALAVLMATSIVAERRQETLVIANWADYIDPELLREFESSTGVRVIMTHFSSDEEMLAKVSFGRPGIDLAMATPVSMEILRKSGLIVPFDGERIPNLRYIDEDFRHLGSDPTGTYSVPYAYGLNGILYNTRMVEGPITSWWAMWDERYAGRLIMLNDMMEAFWLAHHLLGYRLQDQRLDHLDEAYALLKKQRPLLRKYESDLVNDMLLSHEAVMAQAWNGQAHKLSSEHPEYRFVVPEEGASLFIDSLVLLASAPNPDAAHRFIDFLLAPERSSQNMEAILYPMPNATARALLPPEIRDDTTIFPAGVDGKRLNIMSDPGDFRRQIQGRWERLLAE
ncbi:extracellular solute-binding protein [Thiohalocapsa marina]|uniref:Extracellular solute-binding protein n=1 Tax=Thiohalocapsa marina TaxID=424902 RepID=A0A5M8FUF2_9GAMM|nr:extracellular solute-binding protein [Thiohalocapsa marina]KAA6187434.1 extracellular solute-binding protein [Thiohalocapsa marina]